MIQHAKIDDCQSLKNVSVLSPKRVCNKKSAVNQGSIDLFFPKGQSVIKGDYASRNLVTTDETALFYKTQPSPVL